MQRFRTLLACASRIASVTRVDGDANPHINPLRCALID